MKLKIFVIILILSLSYVYSQPVAFDASLTIAAAPTCFDGFQNQGETGVDCGGPCPACDDGDDGGGGGGGGGSSTPVVPPGIEGDTFSKYYFYVKANDTRTILLNVSDLAVYQLEIHFVNEVRNITIEIENKDDDLPIKEPKVSDYDYQYFKISGINLNSDDIGYIKMWYKVSAKWVKKQKTSFSDFIMLNYIFDWEQIDSEFTAYDDTYYYFKSQTNGFGYFSITGIESETVELTDPEKTENPFTRLLEIPGQITIPSLPDIDFGKIWIILLSVLIGAILIGGVFFLSKHIQFKPRETDILKQKYEVKRPSLRPSITKHIKRAKPRRKKLDIKPVKKRKPRSISKYDKRIKEIEEKLKKL